MRSLTWATSHAVFVTEIDDEHQEIFDAVSNLQNLLSNQASQLEIGKSTQRVVRCIVGHFAHEERLMRAARYSGIEWHKRQHGQATRRVQEFVYGIEMGDLKAGLGLIRYLKSWLHDHTRLADQMMGAFLRNYRRIGKVVLRASTKPIKACDWVDSNGERLDPSPELNRI
jgi:hemerythrin